MDILCTRTMEAPYLKQAQAKGIHILCKNYIRTTPVLSSSLKNEIESHLMYPDLTLLFTSKHAVEAAISYYFKNIDPELRGTWHFYCLSGATQHTLLQYVHTDQIIASGSNARELSVPIKSYRKHSPIHFFCGNIRRNTLPDFMRQMEIAYKEWTVYRTDNIPHKENICYDGYLFYSPSAVNSFFTNNAIPADRPCFAIGKTTGEAITGNVSNPVIESKSPSSKAILAELFNYYHIKP